MRARPTAGRVTTGRRATAPVPGPWASNARESLFDLFIGILRPFSLSDPQAFAGRTFRLNRLPVPPAEGPADIDAVFRSIGVELVEQEAHQEAEDVRTESEAIAPDRAAADEFWSSYEAGY